MYESRFFRPFEYALQPPSWYKEEQIVVNWPESPNGVSKIRHYDGPQCFLIPKNYEVTHRLPFASLTEFNGRRHSQMPPSLTTPSPPAILHLLGLTVGQKATFKYLGKNFIITVNQVVVKGQENTGIERGMLSADTYIVFEAAGGRGESGIQVVNHLESASSNIFRQKESNLKALGMGGLSAEFADISKELLPQTLPMSLARNFLSLVIMLWILAVNHLFRYYYFP